jgi:non-specific protein-tyrosine kinase
VSARDDVGDAPATLAHYQAILGRRKWMIVAVPLIAAAIAYVLSARQPPLYEAKASVYIRTTNFVSAFGGVSPYLGDPTRLLNNQAKLAMSQELAARVVENADVTGLSAGGFLGGASATPEMDADVLNLAVSYSSPQDATKLVNAYAEQFARYKNELDTASVQAALLKVQATISRLRAHHQTSTNSYDEALTTRDRLQAFGSIVANSARVQSLADGAAQIRPRPKRTALIAGLLGGFLGIGLAFLSEALDRRVRSAEEIERTLGIPLLGRVPHPKRRLRKAKSLVMLADPGSVNAQTFRRLRTSLEMVNFERRARTIMVTSAIPREGKTTAVANLAVALARAGRRVALVDLDLRRPVLHDFFNTRAHPGFTDVVVHRLKLSDALRSIALPPAGRLPAGPPNGGPPTASGAAGNGRIDLDCVLNVLPAGTIPPAADEFLESSGVAPLLEELRERFDLVLIDTPPLLAVGDVAALNAKMDAIVVVTRLGIQRPQLEELARQLRTCRAPVLGFILTGVRHGDTYNYGYGYELPNDAVRQPVEAIPERS